MTVDEKPHELSAGFSCEYDDDTYTVIWPDGHWLIAKENGTVFVGRSPFSGVLPKKTTPAELLAYESARSAEPVAWRYELACAVRHHPDGSKTGENWKWHLTDFAPNVPDWGIRNLTLLYAYPTPEASDA